VTVPMAVCGRSAGQTPLAPIVAFWGRAGLLKNLKWEGLGLDDAPFSAEVFPLEDSPHKFPRF
jgi:hypothetical protein